MRYNSDVITKISYNPNDYIQQQTTTGTTERHSTMLSFEFFRFAQCL